MQWDLNIYFIEFFTFSVEKYELLEKTAWCVINLIYDFV